MKYSYWVIKHGSDYYAGIHSDEWSEHPLLALRFASRESAHKKLQRSTWSARLFDDLRVVRVNVYRNPTPPGDIN